MKRGLRGANRNQPPRAKVLYYFTGVWVDLDEHKRPKTTPQLFGWATPDGWREGLRSSQSVPQTGQHSSGSMSGKIRAIERIDDLETLKKLILELEAASARH